MLADLYAPSHNEEYRPAHSLKMLSDNNLSSASAGNTRTARHTHDNAKTGKMKTGASGALKVTPTLRSTEEQDMDGMNEECPPQSPTRRSRRLSHSSTTLSAVPAQAIVCSPTTRLASRTAESSNRRLTYEDGSATADNKSTKLSHTSRKRKATGQSNTSSALFANSPAALSSGLSVWASRKLLSVIRDEERRELLSYTELVCAILFGLSETDLPSHLVQPRYLDMLQRMGTLQNGKLYVANSFLDCSQARVESMGRRRSSRVSQLSRCSLGLFAGRTFRKDEVVTTYGGTLIDGDALKSGAAFPPLRDLLQGEKNWYSHARRIPNTHLVRDGRLFALCFDPMVVDNSQIKDRMNTEYVGNRHTLAEADIAGATASPDSLPSNRFRVLPSLCSSGLTDIIDRQRLDVFASFFNTHNASHSPAAANSTLSNPESDCVLQRRASSRRRVETSKRTIDTGKDEASTPEKHDLPLRHFWKLLNEEPCYQALASLCSQINERICRSGVGYMANSSADRSKFNVKVSYLSPFLKEGKLIAPLEILYVAARDIQAHEEIIAPYNNNESKNFQQ